MSLLMLPGSCLPGSGPAIALKGEASRRAGQRRVNNLEHGVPDREPSPARSTFECTRRMVPCGPGTARGPLVGQMDGARLHHRRRLAEAIKPMAQAQYRVLPQHARARIAHHDPDLLAPGSL